MVVREERGPLRIVLTDSGLGGLSVCAKLERELGAAPGMDRPVELIYVNAWPDPGWGYNDLPDPAARAAVLDKALARMAGYDPDLIVIACNTLSVLYELTEFSRNPPVPVRGIIDEGVGMFEEALGPDPESRLILFGTRTTIESGEHIRRLVGRGIAPKRLTGVACHRLAALIDDNPGSPDAAGMIERCVSEDLRRMGAGGRLFAGFVCTHYGYAREAFQSVLDRKAGRPVGILDPNDRLAGSVAAEVKANARPGAGAPSARAAITVTVISKIDLAEAKRRAIARKLEPVSPATAEALLRYTRIADLF